jgi:hypothetical protein
MSAKWKRRGLSLPMILLLACLPLVLTAAATAGYDLSWWSADSGGGISSGGGYTLQGAIGQPDAGLMQGGGFSLAGGLLGGGAAVSPVQALDSFLPLVVR